MTRVQVVYGLFILLILFVLSILSVTEVFLADYSKPALWYLIGAGLGFLYLGSIAIASSHSVGDLFNNMAEVLSQKIGAE